MEEKIESRIASVIYILFAVFFIGGRVVSIPPLLCNFLIALSGFIAFGYCFLRKKLNRIHSYLVLFGAIFTVLMLLSMWYNGNADILDVLWIWSYMGIAALIYEFDISPKVYWCVAYALLLFILVFMFLGKEASELLKIGSENNISVFVIFFVLLGYLSKQNKENKTMVYLPAFLTLAISLWTGSRAGILSAIILVGCVFVNNLIFTKKGKIYTLIKICLLLVAGLWAVNHFFFDYMTQFFEKLDRYGYTSVRTEIWGEYINGMFANFSNFLLGVNMSASDYPLLEFYGRNPHNSLLTLHAKYGILGLLTGCALAFKSMWKAIRNKNVLLVIVTLVAISRLFFDWIAFPGLYDVIFWLLAIYAIDRKDVSPKIEKDNEAK